MEHLFSAWVHVSFRLMKSLGKIHRNRGLGEGRDSGIFLRGRADLLGQDREQRGGWTTDGCEGKKIEHKNQNKNEAEQKDSKCLKDNAGAQFGDSSFCLCDEVPPPLSFSRRLSAQSRPCTVPRNPIFQLSAPRKQTRPRKIVCSNLLVMYPPNECRPTKLQYSLQLA